MTTSSAMLPLIPVMEKYGVTLTPEEFHEKVNLAFHKAESRVYDEIHACMWDSLPEQVALLAEDAMKAGGPAQANLVGLDIGCGTGLATDCLLRTELGRRIAEMDLLDTSVEMLERIQKRSANWKVKTNRINGYLSTLVGSARKYDVIIISSVLHHIPDLPAFLTDIRSLLKPGGVFIHLQDPNGDHFNDPELEKRMADLKENTKQMPGWMRRLSPSRVVGKIRRDLLHEESDSYLDQVAKELVSGGVTKQPMAPEDIWKVTDIHVHDGEGVSIRQMKLLLPDYTLASYRTYSFFGKLRTELPADYQRQESGLIEQNALNGMHVAAAWIAPAE